jgi:hypothetical protein
MRGGWNDSEMTWIAPEVTRIDEPFAAGERGTAGY